MRMHARMKLACHGAVAAAMVFVASTVAAQAQYEEARLHVGAQAGLLGLGITAGYDILESVTVRGQLNRLDYSYDGSEAGNHYTGELALSSTAVFIDWHPGAAFRLTAGVVVNGNELNVGASSTSLDIGAGRYNGELDVQTTFDGLAPYAGIGWSTDRGEPGVGVVIDFGVVFSGVPEVTAHGTIEAGVVANCTVSVAADSSTTLTGSACGLLPRLQQDAMREHEELTDALADFEVYPVASLGLVYRF